MRLMYVSLWLMQCFRATSSESCASTKLHWMWLQVNSFRNQVLFKSAAERLPEGAILLEIGPHAILRSLLHQTRCVMLNNASS